MITGRCCSTGSRFNRSSTETPSSAGMTTSSKTTSNGCSRRISSASWPFAAQPTPWPSCSRLRVRSIRLSGSSSTTSTRPAGTCISRQQVEELGQRRIAGDLDEPACDGLQDLELHAGVVAEQLPEVPPREHKEAEWRLGGDRRHPPGLLEQRDLAEELAACARRQPLAVLCDLDLAVDDHEELVPELALLTEHLAGRNLEVLAHPRKLSELLARETFEQCGAPERLHLRVLAEQLHALTVSSSTRRV